MRGLYNIFSFPILCGFSLWIQSCAKTENITSMPDSEFMLLRACIEAADTKVEVDTNYHVFWKENDALYMLNNQGNSPTKAKFVLSSGANTKRASFVGQILDPQKKYLAIHTTKEITVDDLEVSDAGVLVPVSTSDLMVSVNAEVNSDNEIEYGFCHYNSLLALNLTSDEDLLLSAITIELPENNIITKAMVNWDGKIDYMKSERSKTMSFDVSEFKVDSKGCLIILPLLFAPKQGILEPVKVVVTALEGRTFTLYRPYVDFCPGYSYVCDYNINGRWQGNISRPAYINDRDKSIWIYDASELAWIQNEVSLESSVYDNFNGWNISLKQDIDLGGERQWKPIGQGAIHTSTKRFAGTFDGEGHSINNLYINSESGQQALFCFLQYPGIIKNLSVNGSVEGGSYIAGVCAYNSGGKIDNCHSNVTVRSSSVYSGGICAFNAAYSDGNQIYSGVIAGCSNIGEVVNVNGNIGGIAGVNSGGMVVACINYGEISSEEGNVGGVVGVNMAGRGQSDYAAQINSYVCATCNTDAKVISDHVAKGCIAGRNEPGQTIDNSWYYLPADMGLPVASKGVGAVPAGSINDVQLLDEKSWPNGSDEGWGKIPPAFWVGEWKQYWENLGHYSDTDISFPELAK